MADPLRKNCEIRSEHSLQGWTLLFKDPEEERQYQEYVHSKMSLPWLFRLVTDAGIAFHCVYRLFAIYTITTGSDYPTGSLTQEVGLGLYIITTITFEWLLKQANILKSLRGFFSYMCFPIVSVIAAFSTQRSPRLGLA